LIRGLKIKYQVAFWIIAITLVVGVGVTHFPREFQDTSFWETLYYTLRLFIFENDHGRFPTSWPLILIYFVAPLITLSGIGTAVSYLLRLSPTLKTRLLKGHAIVCGMGRTGRLFARSLKSHGVSVVGIDLCENGDLGEWCDRHNITVLAGSFLSSRLLQKAGIQKARTVIFASGEDLVNLEGALAAYRWIKRGDGLPRLIWAQITDEHMANTARFFLHTPDRVGIRLYDSYHIAAEKMIRKYFNPDRRKGIAKIDIMGFGKFGRDLTEVLIRELHSTSDIELHVFDKRDCSAQVLSLADAAGFSGNIFFECADLDDLSCIYEPRKAFFICTDDDLKNLTAAMALARKQNADHIYVRMSQWPLAAVSEHIGQKHGISFVNISELVREGIADLPGIFQPAELSDLKRVSALQETHLGRY
jgi:Trk K+ transport system NAD-binding subunit